VRQSSGEKRWGSLSLRFVCKSQEEQKRYWQIKGVFVRIKVILFCFILTSCKSTQTIDDDIDNKLEAYNTIKRELCPETITDYTYRRSAGNLSISYKCKGDNDSLFIHRKSLVNITLWKYESILNRLVGVDALDTYSGWTMDELIKINSDYMDFRQKKETKYIRMVSMGPNTFSIDNGYKINLYGANKKQLKDMHNKTISFLHKFQSFSCNEKPLEIESITWEKVTIHTSRFNKSELNRSTAVMSCNGKSFNVNFANDLTLDKTAAEQILFN
jgi:hypothetical protein